MMIYNTIQNLKKIYTGTVHCRENQFNAFPHFSMCNVFHTLITTMQLIFWENNRTILFVFVLQLSWENDLWNINRWPFTWSMINELLIK